MLSSAALCTRATVAENKKMGYQCRWGVAINRTFHPNRERRIKMYIFESNKEVEDKGREREVPFAVSCFTQLVPMFPLSKTRALVLNHHSFHSWLSA